MRAATAAAPHRRHRRSPHGRVRSALLTIERGAESGLLASRYARLTAELMELAGGRLVVGLEGGYSLSATTTSAAAVMEALLGLTPRTVAAPPSPPAPLAVVEETAAAADAGPAVEAASGRGRGAGGRGRGRKSGPSKFSKFVAGRGGAGGDVGGPRKDAAGCDLGARKCLDESLEVHRSFWRSLRRAPPPPPAAPPAEVTGEASMEVEAA